MKRDAGGRAGAAGRSGEGLGRVGNGCAIAAPVPEQKGPGDLAARLRSQSRHLRQLAGGRVVAQVGTLREAAAWLEVLADSLGDGGVQQVERPALRRREGAS